VFGDLTLCQDLNGFALSYQMKQLLIHSLVVAPIVRWITSPYRRWSRKTGLYLAIIALVTIALIQLKRMDPNCYDLLEVGKDATQTEISKAFRKQSIKYHPDRVKSNDALPFGYRAPEDLFIKLQRCSELLTDPTKLSYYSRFGDTNYSFKNESVMFPIMAVFSFIGYIVNFMICSVMTASNESKNGRYFIVCFLIFSFSSEMYMKFLGEIYLFTSGHNLLVYEQIDILKELIPSVLSGALLLSQLIYSNDRK
jgi:hypothetical protein